MTLRKNYRSTPEILNVAEAIIKNNPHRLSGRLEAVRDHGVKPVYFRAKNAKAEADWIISQIRRLLDDGYALNQIGVIYRAHHLTRAIEEKFIKNSVPYRLFSGTEFYNRAEIRDIICYLRMVTIGDDAAFLRTIKVPRRKIGKKTIAILQQSADAKRQSLYQTLKDEMNSKFLSSTYAKSYIYAIETARSDLGRLSLGDLLQKLLDDSGYDAYMRQQGDQDRLDNVAELKRSVIEFGDDEQATLEDFLNNAALFSNIDRDSPHDTVKFLTIHSAKGLEFEVVFLCGLSEGVLPSKRATSIEELQEERRLCYVAMTRAKDLLFLSDSAEIGHDGKFKATSRFIFEAGKNNVDFIVEPDHSPVEQRQEQEKPFSASPFSVNQRVKHTVFGLGIIKEIDYAKGSYLIQFETLETARSLRFSAPLEKV
ncbi:MAG: ATP-dependent helicase [Deltaproteobacteria bacterium]|nr:ATP-dependent helicase [Deltaproteobacteria bacterium]